jgi:phenylalanyl-tRNA synthetase alpha chain
MVDLKTIKKEISEVKTVAQLDAVELKYLAKKGLVRQWLGEIGAQPENKRKEFAQSIHSAKAYVEQAVAELREKLGKSEAGSAKSKAPAETLGTQRAKIGHMHPLSETAEMVNKYFIRQGFSIVEGPHIETDEYNFQRLNLPQDHPARDLWDTIYIEQPNVLLRTQMSSVEARVLAENKPPMKFVCPGRTYRNEKVNPSNHFMFHHYQGVAVDRNINLKDLIGTFDELFHYLYGPKIKLRYRHTYYPEVMIGLAVEMLCFNCKGKGCPVCKNRQWLVAGGAGVIHPKVLEMAGIDSKEWSGYAFGLGLDRMTMARYGINDIRKITSGEIIYKPYAS